MITEPMRHLHDILISTQMHDSLPRVIAFNRIDGPGSSLDLPQFQESLWQLPRLTSNFEDDLSFRWSRNLPRTVGITINTGTLVTAHPDDSPDRNAVASKDFPEEVDGVATPGNVVPTKKNWLLKIMDIFGLRGVKFVLENIHSNTRSSGLGG